MRITKLTKILLIILGVLIISFGLIVWPGNLKEQIAEKYGAEKESTLTAMFEDATAKIGEDKYAEAEPILEDLVKRDPENFSAWLNLGIVYLNLKKPDKAKEALLKAVKINSSSSSAFNLLGNTQRDTDDMEGAKTSYQKAIDLNKRQFNAYINLASVFYNEKNYDAAIAKLIEGKNNIPTYLEIRYMLVSFYINLGRKTEARAELQEILKTKPDDKWANERLKEL